MIVRRPCCGRSALAGFSGVINDFDSFISAVVGAGTDNNRMLLAVSEWLCGAYYSRVFSVNEWLVTMSQILEDMNLPGVRATFVSASMYLINNRSVHKDSACASSGSTTGSSVGMSVEDMIKLGQDATKDTVKIVDDVVDDDNKTTPGTTPGTTTPPTSKYTNKEAGIGTAAILAGVVGAAILLVKRKK